METSTSPPKKPNDERVALEVELEDDSNVKLKRDTAEFASQTTTRLRSPVHICTGMLICKIIIKFCHSKSFKINR